jgi:hypothetical protein
VIVISFNLDRFGRSSLTSILCCSAIVNPYIHCGLVSCIEVHIPLVLLVSLVVNHIISLLINIRIISKFIDNWLFSIIGIIIFIFVIFPLKFNFHYNLNFNFPPFLFINLIIL